ncbi:translation initiation factor IF-3 [Lentisphaerota bacterium ZTH]|nr:translation initiation factor IF-3 [Lentisphaerota bacterium]WET06145.1 translation initiation factor IF-3 [Lentisphaerota bacterium ZTH]
MEGFDIATLLKPNDRSFKAEQVRLVGADGEQIGIVSLPDARTKANAAGLDLVLVAEKAKPPVCRIMDYGKLLYEHKKSHKAQRKHNLTQKVKEVKFHVNIDKHDYEYKINHALQFLGKGYKVKITFMLRGREMAHKDLAYEVMDKVIDDLKEAGTAENRPKFQGRNLSVSFAPSKH